MANGDKEHFFSNISLKQDTGKYFRVQRYVPVLDAGTFLTVSDFIILPIT